MSASTNTKTDLYGNPLPVVMGRGCFFKYKSMSPASLPHVIEIIKDKKIFCPKPSQTNDKDEEFKPPVSVGDFSDPNYKERVKKWVRKIAIRNNPLVTEEQIEHQLSLLTQASLEDFAKQLEPSYHSEIENQYRILSLSDSPSNHHLWVNYSDNYSGICFKFMFNPQFASVYKVNYVEERPKFDLICDQDMETLSATALTKLKKWEDEREYRVVISEPALPYGPVLFEQKLSIPETLFTGIYIGGRTSMENRSLILELAKENLSQTPIYEVIDNSPNFPLIKPIC